MMPAPPVAKVRPGGLDILYHYDIVSILFPKEIAHEREKSLFASWGSDAAVDCGDDGSDDFSAGQCDQGPAGTLTGALLLGDGSRGDMFERPGGSESERGPGDSALWPLRRHGPGTRLSMDQSAHDTAQDFLARPEFRDGQAKSERPRRKPDRNCRRGRLASSGFGRGSL